MENHSSKPSPESLLAHTPWVRSLARALVLDPDQADEVVQQTWVAALQGTPKKIFNLKGWLGGITRNIVRENRRSNLRRESREQRSASPEPLPSTQDLVERADLQRKVVQAVLDLKEPYRSALLLRYFEELTAEEIARRNQIPASTVRNQVKRGLDLLRHRFDLESGGNRRTWTLSMIPLALPSQGAKAATVVAGASAATGVMTMSLKIMIVTGVLGLGAVTVHHTSSPTTTETVPSDRIIEVAEASLPASLPQETQEESPRQPVPTKKESEQSRTNQTTGKGAHGQVKDQAGKPVEGARIFVGGTKNPFPEEATVLFHLGERELIDGEEAEEWLAHARGAKEDLFAQRGILLGRMVESDSKGKFTTGLHPEEKLYLCLIPSRGIRRAGDSSCGWQEKFNNPISITAKRIPLGSLTVTVLDQTKGKHLKEFHVGIASMPKESVEETREKPGDWFRDEQATSDGKLGWEIEVPASTLEVMIWLTDPIWGRARKTAIVKPGEETQIVFHVQSGAGHQGMVLGADGQPLKNALVFWGDLDRIRGEGWFRKYREESISDGVRTDAHGRFTLPGNGEEISVWHDEFSPVTASLAESASIRMIERGTIRARLAKEDGTPWEGREFTLDRSREAVTDKEGLLIFDKVVAGMHAVWSRGVGYFVMQVEPGETVEIPLNTVIDEVNIETLAGEDLVTDAFGGAVLGQDKVSTLHEFGSKGGRIKIKNILPGHYFLMGRNRQGGFFMGWIDIQGPAASVELGGADLTIQGKPGTRIYLIPKGVNPLTVDHLRHWIREIPESGNLLYDPIPAGSYQIGIGHWGNAKTVQVREGTVVSLD